MRLTITLAITTLSTPDCMVMMERGTDLGSADSPIPHNALRWAGLILAVCEARHDPRTVTDWARLVHMGEPTIRTWCRIVGVSPKRSLGLARVARAVILSTRHRCHPEDLLDVRDPRTLRKLLEAGGLSVPSARLLPPQLAEYFESQRFATDRIHRLAFRTLLGGAIGAVSAETAGNAVSAGQANGPTTSRRRRS